MKTRDEIITKCVKALQACFNHYSDEPLDEYVIGALKDLLVFLLPETISTLQWQTIVDQWAARVLEESGSEEDKLHSMGELKP